MKKIGWENGILISKAKVTIAGNIYDVEPEQYEGNTPLSAENLKKMENNIEEEISRIDLTFEEKERECTWKTIEAVDISEGNSKTFENLINAKEVIIVHEKNGIYLATQIVNVLSGMWIKNQSQDIYASVVVNFTTGRVQNGSSSDTNTWIKKIIYR